MTSEKLIKKTRVNRYCPKLENIQFNLECEWNNCDYISNDMDDYLKHIDIEHLNEINNKNLDCKWLDCDMDHEKFDSVSTYERHIRFHAFHTKLKFIGRLVIENFNKSVSQPNSKINKNILAINQNYINECSLDNQSRNLIPELPYKFECSWDKCEYNTDNPELFYRHIKKHIDEIKNKILNNKKKTNKFPFKCLWNDCTQDITSLPRLIEHMRHHSQEKLVACHVCGALFSTFTKYIDHCGRTNSVHTSKDDTNAIKFQCSHCNKKFLTNNLLREHIRKHINKFKCPSCDMTCISKQDLNKHILYKHSTNKSFKCEYCDQYSAKTLNDLNKHIQLKHDKNQNEYKCNDCDDFKTKNLNLMKKHMMKYHLNNSKLTYLYKCHECDKTYSNGSTLSLHLKNVHNYKWPSGHSRFRYRLDNDGYYRLQTLRYESIELVEQLNREKEEEKQKQQQQQQTNSLFQEIHYNDDDRVNDFDDEDENINDSEMCNDVNDDFEKSTNSKKEDINTYNNSKDYLIKRLIDDEYIISYKKVQN